MLFMCHTQWTQYILSNYCLGETLSPRNKLFFSAVYEYILFCRIACVTTTCYLDPQLQKTSPMYIEFA